VTVLTRAANLAMMKGRLQPELLDRSEDFADRCVAVAEELDRAGRFRRIVEQLAASGSSIGANLAEADQAMSLRDFRKCLSITAKELAETRFWLRLVIRRTWLPESRLTALLDELAQLRKIVGALLARTRESRKNV
jgi:four helix bundle protein